MPPAASLTPGAADAPHPDFGLRLSSSRTCWRAACSTCRPSAGLYFFANSVKALNRLQTVRGENSSCRGCLYSFNTGTTSQLGMASSSAALTVRSRAASQRERLALHPLDVRLQPLVLRGKLVERPRHQSVDLDPRGVFACHRGLAAEGQVRANLDVDADPSSPAPATCRVSCAGPAPG